MSLVLDPPRTLREVLEHCAQRVPLYRGVGAPREGESTDEALARFPVLSKEGKIGRAHV